ncbi:MAG: class I SAM-dependent methyltransferase [Kiritimatiellae bacterium]|nr:class I SAM-dependent methyltransferase [Kiritimatiellia bacterium]
MWRELKLLWKHRSAVRTALGRHIALLEGDGDAASLGGLTDDEVQGLITWLPDEGVFVEFGTLFGLTAKAVAAAKPKLKTIALDNFSWNPFGLPGDLHEAFTRRILANELADGRVELVKADSADFRANWSGAAPDAVFLDALHQYEPVRDEIAWAKKTGCKCICGHDYASEHDIFGVTQAVMEAFPGGIAICGPCWR